MFDLYKELIIDHGMNPRNKCVIDKYTHYAEGFNYLCGDSFTVYLDIDNKFIKNISFNGVGCTISTASASLMTSMFKNKNIDFSLELFKIFHDLMLGKLSKHDKFTNLNVLSNVKKFPSRIKCATLVWNTFFKALSCKI